MPADRIRPSPVAPRPRRPGTSWRRGARALGPAVLLATAAFLAPAGKAPAQDPLSAIDWLSRSMAATPGGTAVQPERPEATPGGGSLVAREIGVAMLDAPRLDALGLLPAERAGLPHELWGMTPAAEVAERLARLGPDTLPALQRLALALLLAELAPPRDAGTAASETLLLTRLDRLIAFGALDQALALAEAAGTATPALFARWLDLSLLAGDVAPACDALRAAPELSEDVAARIYCRARGGDWAAADALLAGAEAETLPDGLRAALDRFLDPEADHDPAPLALGSPPSPLMWQLADALGEAVPTATLPLAYAHADLGPGTGWKAQIEAAERLTRAGALTPNRLLGLYTERAAAASGGVWERVRAVQALEAALLAEDADTVAALLPPLWALMNEAELETAFAELYADRLLRLRLTEGTAATLAWRAGLLAGSEAAHAAPRITGARDAFLHAVAAGRPGPDWPGSDWAGPGWPDTAAPPPGGAIAAAVAEGLRAAPDAATRAALDEARHGEVLLAAMELLQGGGSGDARAVAGALMQLRAAGQEEVARRAALQILLLDRRG